MSRDRPPPDRVGRVSQSSATTIRLTATLGNRVVRLVLPAARATASARAM